MHDFIQYFEHIICPTKCSPRENKTLIRFVTDYLLKYIGLSTGNLTDGSAPPRHL